ncbi:MAG: hypothetical protein A2Y94_09955 [Caldithrix sp. RBG_13_44_9]|nr:MAG: hypothetical protein A2Y94_09955 [Caldithrix sp. RBG_13_44_9]
MDFIAYYYLLRPIIPRRIQVIFRRILVQIQKEKNSHIWPIDEGAKEPPEDWQGWPNGKKFCLVLTHDVEAEKGYKKFRQLMLLEKELGFRSSFNFVPERYHIDDHAIHEIKANGFEVGVHGLKHDGKLYQSFEIFKERAYKINQYLSAWEAKGFRSPSMQHHLPWLHLLNIDYDASTFDTDPFEPQPDGIRKIFPFWYINNSTDRNFIELPYTLPQDFTLFILMKENNIEIWKKKLDWIIKNGGMALLITHPDYINYDNSINVFDEYPLQYYQDFLNYIQQKYSGLYWNPLPAELAKFWKTRAVRK